LASTPEIEKLDPDASIQERNELLNRLVAQSLAESQPTTTRKYEPLWPRVRDAMRAAPIERKVLAILLILFVAKGVLFTFIFPPFSGHDEVAHYMYLEFVAEDGRPPLIPDKQEWQEEYAVTKDQQLHDHIDPALWDYCWYVTQDWYRGCREVRWMNTPVYAINLGPEVLPSGWVYTANHPPLYYLVMTPIFWIFSAASIITKLYILRLAAIPFGLITIFFAYKTTRVIFPGDRFLAMLVPAFVAFQPQISYEAAMLNNDIFSIAFTSIVFYLLALGLRQGFPWRVCMFTGFCFGLAMLSKNTSAVSGLIIAVAMILGLGIRNWRLWIPRGAVTGIVAGLLIWPWYLYMWTTYGDLTALDRIEALQYWNYGGGPGRSVWSQLKDGDFAWWRWKETWGEFGWRLIPLDDGLLRIIMTVCVIGLLGVAWWAIQSRLVLKGRILSFRSEHGYLTVPSVVPLDDPRAPRSVDTVFRPDRVTRVAVLTLVISCIVAYYAILQFGTTFSLTQARYYFPSVNAAAILIMLGYRALTPRRWHPYVEASFLLAWFALNLVIFSEYVIPYWQEGL
jgi:4-amino-4-deoxy-L-arabinose transferase-like glycosyltransferase